MQGREEVYLGRLVLTDVKGKYRSSILDIRAEIGKRGKTIIIHYIVKDDHGNEFVMHKRMIVLPKGLIYILDVVVEDEGEEFETTLKFSSEDFYQVGFQNNISGRWFCCNDKKAFFPKHTTPLPFSSHLPPRKELNKHPIGFAQLKEAIKALARAKKSDNQDMIKEKFFVTVIMVPEAVRSDHILDECCARVRMDEDLGNEIHKWADRCVDLLAYHCTDGEYQVREHYKFVTEDMDQNAIICEMIRRMAVLKDPEEKEIQEVLWRMGNTAPVVSECVTCREEECKGQAYEAGNQSTSDSYSLLKYGNVIIEHFIVSLPAIFSLVTGRHLPEIFIVKRNHIMNPTPTAIFPVEAGRRLTEIFIVKSNNIMNATSTVKRNHIMNPTPTAISTLQPARSLPGIFIVKRNHIMNPTPTAISARCLPGIFIVKRSHIMNPTSTAIFPLQPRLPELFIINRNHILNTTSTAIPPLQPARSLPDSSRCHRFGWWIVDQYYYCAGGDQLGLRWSPYRRDLAGVVVLLLLLIFHLLLLLLLFYLLLLFFLLLLQYLMISHQKKIVAVVVVDGDAGDGDGGHSGSAKTRLKIEKLGHSSFNGATMEVNHRRHQNRQERLGLCSPWSPCTANQRSRSTVGIAVAINRSHLIEPPRRATLLLTAPPLPSSLIWLFFGSFDVGQIRPQIGLIVCFVVWVGILMVAVKMDLDLVAIGGSVG
ncbi:hypothetical protein Tsubulata_024140 [Turnera subulata]|uniref:Uncharacterized protein n=1 Tax=Turnera subulata TaxID=218843 RepID=A0A9Q0FT96_9ROSI|nr:hypothetical protein Tsubulata_024140 [Turnera subulata]